MILCIDIYLDDIEKEPVVDPNDKPKTEEINFDEQVQGMEIKTVSHDDIGKCIDILPGKDSLSDSLKVYEIKDLIKNNGNEIKSIKNINGEELQENSLIGTGTTIELIDENKYTAIVYGDGTGDGEINSADMAVVINSFLNDEELPKYFRLAIDVEKDESFDSLDIARMINHFLGTENETILNNN